MTYLIVSKSGGSDATFDSKALVLELNGELYSVGSLQEAADMLVDLWKGAVTIVAPDIKF